MSELMRQKLDELATLREALEATYVEESQVRAELLGPLLDELAALEKAYRPLYKEIAAHEAALAAAIKRMTAQTAQRIHALDAQRVATDAQADVVHLSSSR